MTTEATITSTVGEDFIVTQYISEESVRGLLCSGFEGGVGYWCKIMGYCEPAGGVQSSDPKYMDYPLRDGAVICRIDDGDTTASSKALVLDRAAIERGLALMAQKWPRHWNNFVSENYDAETGDVFIQLCLLGDIVYG